MNVMMTEVQAAASWLPVGGRIVKRIPGESCEGEDVHVEKCLKYIYWPFPVKAALSELFKSKKETNWKNDSCKSNGGVIRKLTAATKYLR